jgi:hypothetical protein
MAARTAAQEVQHTLDGVLEHAARGARTERAQNDTRVRLAARARFAELEQQQHGALGVRRRRGAELLEQLRSVRAQQLGVRAREHACGRGARAGVRRAQALHDALGLRGAERAGRGPERGVEAREDGEGEVRVVGRGREQARAERREERARGGEGEECGGGRTREERVGVEKQRGVGGVEEREDGREDLLWGAGLV